MLTCNLCISEIIHNWFLPLVSLLYKENCFRKVKGEVAQL